MKFKPVLQAMLTAALCMACLFVNKTFAQTTTTTPDSTTTTSISAIDDFGNNCSTAQPVALNTTVDGAINYGGDYDYFAVQAPEFGAISAYITGSADIRVRLRNASCNIADDSEFAASFYNRNIPSGTYYVDIQHADSESTGAYSLHVNFTSFGSQPDWQIETVAGEGTTPDGIGDRGMALNAILYEPSSVALDSAGNIFIADSNNHRIRKITAATGIITTVAGTGVPGYSGDNDPAPLAMLQYPTGVAVDNSGNLYIADYGNFVIRKVDSGSGNITTVAGGGDPEDGLGDNGPALDAAFTAPCNVVLDSNGNIYIVESLEGRVRKVDVFDNDNRITTVAGGGTPAVGVGDGGAATAAALDGPNGIAFDGSGNMYIAEWDGLRVRKVEALTQDISTIAGGGSPSDNLGDNGPATAAMLSSPAGVAVDNAGNVYIADSNEKRIRMVDAGTQHISTIAGGAY